jgi:hypothetical protein
MSYRPASLCSLKGRHARQPCAGVNIIPPVRDYEFGPWISKQASEFRLRLFTANKPIWVDNVKEILRRRITATSSLKEISTYQLGNRVMVRGRRRYKNRVFTKFCILEISYISYVFLNFVYYSKVATISRK